MSRTESVTLEMELGGYGSHGRIECGKLSMPDKNTSGTYCIYHPDLATIARYGENRRVLVTVTPMPEPKRPKEMWGLWNTRAHELLPMSPDDTPSQALYVFKSEAESTRYRDENLTHPEKWRPVNLLDLPVEGE